ncbi:hypothetical protein MMC19_006077 [Ptychographa xylographoides]|nr:hypothetical protein [Ptychographa xylographoides]
MGADAKRKASRKRKFSGGPERSSDAGYDNAERAAKQKKDDTKAIEGPKNGDTSSNFLEEAKLGPAEMKAKSIKRSTKTSRFICFIGNLPFTATQASVAHHFAKVQPSAVRYRISKDTGKSKGFAFLEFDNYDRMKTCLQKYHHSNFDDGHSPARSINVELTAGGGGSKSQERKSKLLAKNEKLNEQRDRRAHEGEKGDSNGASRPPLSDDAAIHPSRRGMVTIA